MMPTLNDLPYDIKYSILRHVGDRHTLLDLVTTSRPFLDVFSRHKDRMVRNVQLSEAAAYAPDSYMFAYCRRSVLGCDDIKDLIHLVRGYATYNKTGVRPTALNVPTASYDPQKLDEYLIEDYNGIRKMAKAYQFAPRTFLKEGDLTDAELKRIIQAIYRAWTLVLLYYKRDCFIGEVPGDYDSHFLERLIHSSWSIWEALQIRAVIMELRVLPLGRVDATRPRFAAELEQEFENSALKPVMIAAGNARPEMTLISPMFSYSATSKIPDAYFTLQSKFAEYLFIHHTPSTLAPLYIFDSNFGGRAVFNALATALPTQIKTFLGTNWRSPLPGAFALDSLDTLRFAITKMAKEIRTQPGQAISYTGVIPTMRLIEVRQPGVESVFPKKAIVVGPTSWIKRARLGNSVFDDWRLKLRGFHFPIFDP